MMFDVCVTGFTAEFGGEPGRATWNITVARTNPYLRPPSDEVDARDLPSQVRAAIRHWLDEAEQ